jgi:hypothetical protein
VRAGSGAGAWGCAIGAAWIAGVITSACVSIEPWACEGDEDCRSASGAGRCEETRYCSYPDDGCTSTRRYSDLAGPYAGLCTEPEPETGSSSGAAEPVTSSGEPVESSTGAGSSGESDTGTGCVSPCVPGGTERWSLVLQGGMPGSDKLNAVIELGTGDLLAVGFVYEATRDAFLVQVSPEGEVVASRAYDVAGQTDNANDVVLGTDGGLWVCGSRYLAANEDAWIAKFPAQLEGEPEETVIGHDVCRTIGLAASNLIVAGGSDYGSSGRAWVYAFEPWAPEDGTTVSDQGTGASDGLRASVRIDGGFVLGGTQDGLGLAFGLDDLAVGPILVEAGEGGGVQGLAVSDDVLVAGGFLDATRTLHDAWITARDLAGRERWAFQPRDPSVLDDEIEAVAIAPTGEVVAVGFAGAAGHQRWVLELDPDGTLSWSVLLDVHAPEATESSDIARDVVVLDDGDIVVVGEVTAADGMLDAWMARLSGG